MGLLDALIYGYRQILDSANNILPSRSRVRYLGSATVVDNQLNDTTDVTVGAGSASNGPTITNSSTGAITAASSQSSGIDATAILFTGVAPDLSGVDPGSGTGRELGVFAQGGPLIVRNDGGGASASFRILTGTGADVTIPVGSSGILVRDTVSSRWRLVVGSTGGGGGEVNLAANVGSGAGLIFRDKTGVTLNLKSLKTGSNITITNNPNDITLDGPVPGETNLAANVGSGAGNVFKNKTGVTLNMKTLLAGANVTITDNLNDITIAAAGGGGGGGSASLGTTGQVNVSDGAGAWIAPTNLYAGSSYFTVGVAGTPTNNGIRLASGYVLSFRNSSSVDIIGMKLDPSDNLLVGNVSGLASLTLDSPTGTTINLRVGGSTKFWVGGTINTSINPLDFSGGATTTGSILRLPTSNASAVVAGTKPVLATDSSTVYVGTDNALSTQATWLWLAGGTHVSIGTGSTEYAAAAAGLWQGGAPRVGLSTMWGSDGQVPIAITTSGKTLVAAEYSRKIWKFTGSSGGSGTVTVPSVGFDDHSVTKVVRNTSTTDLVFANGGALSTTVHAGRAGRIHITPDGVFGFDWSTSATGSTVTGQA